MIRYAVKKDVKIAFELINLLRKDECTFEQFEKCFDYNLQHNHILLFDKNDEILGIGVLAIVYPLHHADKIAEVMEIVTAEGARGKGVGKKILDEMMRLAAQKGCAGIELASNKKRIDAHRFYEREGFIPTHYKFTKEIGAI